MKPRLAMLIRLILGVVFLWASLAKLLAPAAFFGALLGYQLPLGETTLRLLALTLPWLELLCGAALIGNFWPETVRPVVAALCLGFILALTQALLRGLPVDCGCFGGAGPVWLAHPAVALGRALLLFAASLALLPVPAATSGR